MDNEIANHIAQIANYIQTQGLQTQPLLVDALKEALIYPGSDRPALVARIPVICNDIRWIKRGIFGIYGILGLLLASFIVTKLLL